MPSALEVLSDCKREMSRQLASYNTSHIPKGEQESVNSAWQGDGEKLREALTTEIVILPYLFCITCCIKSVKGSKNIGIKGGLRDLVAPKCCVLGPY